jgi:hypothetical protein
VVRRLKASKCQRCNSTWRQAMDFDQEEFKVPKSRWPVVVGLLVLAGAGGGAYYYFYHYSTRVQDEPRVQTEAVAPPVTEAAVSEEEEVDGGKRFSIDDGEGLLKRLAAGWSSSPTFLKWLEGFGLRQLVGAVQLVADGESPSPLLPFISVPGAFQVKEEAGAAPARPGRKRAPVPPEHIFLEEASYARYDTVAETVRSINAASAGDAWARIRPYANAAFRDIRRPGTRFDDVLTAAVRRLVNVQFPTGEVELVPKGALYAFKDPALEGLSRAEKHLLRMGPKNGRALQAKLREFADHAHLDIGP